MVAKQQFFPIIGTQLGLIKCMTDFKNLFKIYSKRKNKKKIIFNECHLIKTQLNLTPNFLFQNNPKSKYYCKNELIYKRDFEAIQKTHSHVHVLSCLKT